jgi:hypothetical protein
MSWTISVGEGDIGVCVYVNPNELDIVARSLHHTMLVSN